MAFTGVWSARFVGRFTSFFSQSHIQVLEAKDRS